MQDRYAFDIGDFSKFGLLRALAPVGRLGLLWYLNPHLGTREAANGDGRHKQHLTGPRSSDFARCDTVLQRSMVERFLGGRDLAALEPCLGVADTVFIRDDLPRTRSVDERTAWLKGALPRLAGCAVVCCDPDNGVAYPDSANEKQASAKHLLLREAVALTNAGHSLVLYHHFARRPHELQARELHDMLADRLGLPVKVLRWNSVSPRAYAVVMQPGHRDAMESALDGLLSGHWGTGGHFRLAVG